MTHGAGDAALHRECWDQLPWLANETLDARQLASIEPHLRSCRECQDELEAQRRLRDAIRCEDSVVVAPQGSLQKLMQRLDGKESPAGEAPDAKAARVRSTPRWPRWAAAAAAVQAVAIGVLLVSERRSAEDAFTAPRYTTLTEPGIAAGPVIRVVFESSVALSEVNAILRSVDAQIVAGPSEAGVYTLALRDAPESASGGEAGIDAAHMNTTLARLRADPRVLFAESAVTGPAPGMGALSTAP